MLNPPLVIKPNLCVSDLSVFVWFQQDKKGKDSTDPTLRFVARAEKPIQSEFPSRTSSTKWADLPMLPKFLVTWVNQPILLGNMNTNHNAN